MLGLLMSPVIVSMLIHASALHVMHYDADVVIDTGARTIRGDETLTVTPTSNDIRLSAGMLNVRQVSCDEQPVPFRRDGVSLIITPPAAKKTPML